MCLVFLVAENYKKKSYSQKKTVLIIVFMDESSV